MPPQPIPNCVEQCLLWLNYPVWHHWLVATSCLTLVVLLAFAATREAHLHGRWWRHPLPFAVLLVITLAAFRWPTWFVQDGFNPDESQVIAGALTLRQHPVYWQYVDGTTQGPLNAYALTASSRLGLPLNFFGARVLALLLQAGALLLTWAALRRLVSEQTARLAILPALVFWSFTSHHDFIHYSSELVSVFLLALATWLLPGAQVHPGNRTRVFLAGACLGVVPFAKLQGVPPALALTAIGFAMLWPGRRENAGGSCLGWFIAGGVVSPATIVLLIAIFGQAMEAWNVYVLNNLWYVQSAPASVGKVSRLLDLVNQVPAFRWFWWGAFAFAGTLAVPAWWHGRATSRWLQAASWFMLVAGMFAVLVPGRSLAHYLEFLVIPLAWLFGAQLPAEGINFSRSQFLSLRNLAALLALVGLGVVPQIISLARNPNLFAGQFAHYRYEHHPSQAAYFIHSRAQPGDTLATWGWYPQIYVDTGLAQGTREAQTERQFADGTMRGFYRDRYLRDMRTRRPAWFVDAVGPASLGYHDRNLHGYESFPELAALLQADYEFMADIEGLRIFHRK